MSPFLNAETLKRFEKKINYNGVQTKYVDTPCHEWTGATRPNGTGRAWVNGRNMEAHQVAKMHYHGFRPDTSKKDGRTFYRHLCGNEICVNPDHIVAETLTYMERLKQRFEEKFIPEPNSGCWLWIGSLDTGGYGNIGVDGTGKLMLAHRVSLMIYRGIEFIKNLGEHHGECSLHKCHNRCCVNPDHLYVGDHQQNMDDMKKAKRGSKNRGEDIFGVVLKEKDIPVIRKLIKEGVKIIRIAEMFGVTKGAITSIKNNKSWSWVK